MTSGGGGGAGAASVYTDIDVARFPRNEAKIVLCEAQKSQLNILVLAQPLQIVDRQTIKVKRRKAEKWIVRGPVRFFFGFKETLIAVLRSSQSTTQIAICSSTTQAEKYFGLYANARDADLNALICTPIFRFDGSNFRLLKIIADVQSCEVCSIEALNGWCYVLCRHPLCVQAFLYKSEC